MKPFLRVFGLLVATSALSACVTRVSMDSMVACQDGIAEWAEQYDPVRVDTVSTGLAEYSEGGQSTPLHVRIVYDRQGGLETREAEVKCTINRDGVVVAVM